MLDLLRIKADVNILEYPEGFLCEEDTVETKDHTKIFQASKLVQSWSEDTAVSFLYLPSPGKRDHSIGRRKDKEYLKFMANLTSEWPPTLMVRGVSPVTSVTL